jgi:hypothetical protein
MGKAERAHRIFEITKRLYQHGAVRRWGESETRDAIRRGRVGMVVQAW